MDDVCFDLLSRMLEMDPSKRISAKDALDHLYFKPEHHPAMCTPDKLPRIDKDSHEYQQRIQSKQKQQQQQNQNRQNNYRDTNGNNYNNDERRDQVVGNKNHNQNYYNKNNIKHEGKYKSEEGHQSQNQNQVPAQGWAAVTNIVPQTSSNLETLLTNKNMLNNKRQNESSEEMFNEKEESSFKKQKNEINFSPEYN
jgi:serine/threonine protein kinase